MFEREIATYNRLLPELLVSDEGRYVAILGDTLLGVFDTARDALAIGREKLGLDTLFLVREIAAAERVEWVF